MSSDFESRLQMHLRRGRRQPNVALLVLTTVLLMMVAMKLRRG